MEFFFFIIFCAVVGCLVYRVNTTTKNTEDIMSRFKYFASKYGLQPQDDNLFFGEFGGVPLSIKAVSASEYKTSLLHVKFKASHSNGNEGYLTLRPEMVGNKVGKLLGSKDLEIKDTEFDQRVWVETSDPLYARAYLSNEVRGLVLQLTGDGRAGFSVDKDEIRCDRTVDDIATGRQLEQIAELITRLAFLLSQDEPLPVLVRRNFAEESLPTVRCALLETLGRAGERFDADDPVIRQSIHDPDRELRFVAARLMKQAGYPLIKTLFSDSPTDLQIRILEYAAENQAEELAPFFRDAADQTTHLDIKSALARYFGTTNYEGAEAFLRAELERNEENPTEYNAVMIWALGNCGTYASIEFLDRKKDSLHSQKVDQAIARIQERIGSGDEGWLSIRQHGDEEGRLSLAEGEGQISPAEDEEEQS